MFDFRIGSPMIIPVVILLTTGPHSRRAVADDPSLATAAEHWSTSGWPLLQKFCLDCHNEETQEGELDLSGFGALDALEGGAGSMQRVLEMVRFGAMPPEDAELPTDEERKTLVSSLDRTMFAVSCDLRPRPGKVTARRLNRAEYNNSIRDLFGLDLRPADAFPSDEVGAGFDNNGDVLSLSPMLIEKYIAAAEDVSTKVLIDPETLPKLDDERASDQLLLIGDSQTGSFNGRFLAPDAFVWADFEVPVPGEYEIRVSGGNSWRGREPTMVAVYNEQGVLVGKDELEYYGGSGGSKRFEFKIELSKGRHRFYVEPLEEKQDLSVGKTRSTRLANLDSKAIDDAVKRQKQQLLKANRKIYEAKYPFMVRSIRVSGPSKLPDDAFPPSQHEILRRVAEHRDDNWYEVEQAATECLLPLMRRAFREPVSKEEVKPYAQLVVTATERGASYYRGLQVAISAVLVSPRFLFRVETPPQGFKYEADGSVKLTPHQMATRLSYFLWSSLPDEQLLKDADRRKFEVKAIEQHVRRLLADPKSEALGKQFATQWLGLRNLDEHEADTDQFKSFTPTLKQAMSRETEMLFMHVLRNNRPVAELLTSDYTFLNAELAAHYGIEIDAVDKGNLDRFHRVSLAETPRRGVLSHASVLTLTSNPGRTSPVKRGKWILENVLGTPPPEPPPGVPELEETKTAGANASLREQMEVHRTDPSCAACHRVMDQLGFGLEQFDAIGRYRETERDLAIDASGELPGGRVFNGAAELSGILGETEVEAFARTVVHRLMTFALGRELTPADRCAVDEIVQKTSQTNHRFADLVLEVVNSRPFQYYDWAEPE